MMELSAADQRIGDLEAKLNQAVSDLVGSENYALQLEKQNRRYSDMIIKLVAKDLNGDRCCE